MRVWIRCGQDSAHRRLTVAKVKQTIILVPHSNTHTKVCGTTFFFSFIILFTVMLRSTKMVMWQGFLGFGFVIYFIIKISK